MVEMALFSPVVCNKVVSGLLSELPLINLILHGYSVGSAIYFLVLDFSQIVKNVQVFVQVILLSPPHPTPPLCNKGVSLSELPLIQHICQAKLKSLWVIWFGLNWHKCLGGNGCRHPTPPLCNKGVSGRLSESPQCFHWPTITQCFVKRAQSNICLGPQLIFDLDDLSIFCHRLVTNYLLPIVYFIHPSMHI